METNQDLKAEIEQRLKGLEDILSRGDRIQIFINQKCVCCFDANCRACCGKGYFTETLVITSPSDS